MQTDEQRLADLAVSLLERRSDAVSYREILDAFLKAPGSLNRAQLSELIGDLPNLRMGQIHRSKPGYFSAEERVRAKLEPVISPSRLPERPLPNRIETLEKAGFEHVGFWSCVADGLHIRVPEFQPNTWVAFVVGKDVMYLGKPMTRPSTIRFRSTLIKALRRSEVLVYALDLDLISNKDQRAEVMAFADRMRPAWNLL